MRFTRTIKREVVLRSAVRGLADRSWTVAIGIGGIKIRKKGGREEWSLSWFEIISTALVHKQAKKFSASVSPSDNNSSTFQEERR
jgi:hypothetical protein